MVPPGTEPGRDEPVAVRVLGRAIALVNGLMLGISAAAVLVSLLLIGWSVVMRYVFNRAPIWVDEMVGFMLVGIVMLAAAEVLRNGGHIGVDLFTARLRGRRRLWARAWAAFAVLAAAAVLIVNGWQSAMFSRTLGIVTEGHLELPVYLLMLFLPFGGLLLALTAIEALVRLAVGAPPLTTTAHGPEEIE